MQQRSYLKTLLHRKRQISMIKKIIFNIIFLLFFISMVILCLTSEKVRINDIKISGNVSVSTEQILNDVISQINSYYFWIIPTDNVFLLRRSAIKNKILLDIKDVSGVKIIMHSLSQIEVVITERETNALWCTGTPTSTNTCYFMDSNGFIFSKAPNFSENSLAEYFGVITDNPLGKYYFKDKFVSISDLFLIIKRLSFQPEYFNAIDEHEYEIYILGGGKILFNDKEDFQTSLVNLEALVNNNYIKTDPDFLKKIKYIDLRFGNKVNFQLR